MAADLNQAGRIRIALAELNAGGNVYCYRRWFAGRSKASLERELRRLDAEEEADRLRIRTYPRPQR